MRSTSEINEKETQEVKFNPDSIVHLSCHDLHT